MKTGALIRVVAWLALWGGAGLAHAQGVPGVRFTVTRFEVLGENPIGAPTAKAVLGPYLGEHDGLERLLDAATALEKAIRARGHAFHRVVLPPQTLQAGVVKLEVIGFKLTAVSVTGNSHFTRENILASLPPLALGEVPNTTELSRATRVANRHPSKDVKVGFADSKASDGIEARVTVADERPWSLFAAVDNTGSSSTGDYRISFGGQYTNLLHRDHVVTLSYTTSPTQANDVRQIGANYELPLYRYATNVTIFFADSDVDTGEVAGLAISGAGTFVGLRVRHELHRGERYTHAVTLGLDDKLFVSNVVPVGGGPSLFPDVRSRPLSFSYSRDYQALWGQLQLDADYVINLPFGGANNGGAYRANRAGAEASWNLLRADAHLDYAAFGAWLVRSELEAQWSPEPLISGEQFGLGGAHSVRGFEEREVSGDSGVRATLELWGPPMGKRFDARLMGFFDWGHVNIRSPAVGQDGDESIAGIGVGARLQGAHWSVRAMLARVLDPGGTRLAQDLELHLNVVVRY